MDGLARAPEPAKCSMARKHLLQRCQVPLKIAGHPLGFYELSGLTAHRRCAGMGLIIEDAPAAWRWVQRVVPNATSQGTGKPTVVA